MTGWLSIQDSNAFIAAKQAEGLTGEEIGVAWHDYLEARAEALKPLWEAQAKERAAHSAKVAAALKIEEAEEAEYQEWCDERGYTGPDYEGEVIKAALEWIRTSEQYDPAGHAEKFQELRRAAHTLAVEDDYLRWGDEA